MKYRSKSEITSMILEAARSGSTKTKMMYNGYLSYSQIVEYLKYLRQNGLITYEKDTRLYRPTARGLKFLNLLNEVNEMTLVASSKNYHT